MIGFFLYFGGIDYTPLHGETFLASTCYTEICVKISVVQVRLLLPRAAIHLIIFNTNFNLKDTMGTDSKMEYIPKM